MSGGGDLPEALVGPSGSKTQHRFLSPHYDDIALSCGGTAALLARAGLAPEVAIVFGEEPDPAAALTPFAAAMHRGWGLDAQAVVARRRAEEAAAAAVLGTTVSSLPFHDAIYRHGHYQSDDQLFGEVAAAEAHLPASIISALGLDVASDPTVRIYAPLGVGRHVDHQHVFAAGIALTRAGWDVWFYEDLPYGMQDGAVETRLGDIGALLAPVTIEVSTTWEAKIAAVLAYPSQLTTVFGYVGGNGSAEDSARRLRDYAVGVGGGMPAERFWRLPGDELGVRDAGVAK